MQPEQLTAQDRFEMTLAGSELRTRLYELQRECMLLAEKLGAEEKVAYHSISSTQTVMTT